MRTACPPVEFRLDRQTRTGDFGRCKLDFHTVAPRRGDGARSAEGTPQRSGRSVDVDIGEGDLRSVVGREVHPTLSHHEAIQRDAIREPGEFGAEAGHRSRRALSDSQDRALEVDLAEAELSVEQAAGRQLESHPVAQQRRLVPQPTGCHRHSRRGEVRYRKKLDIYRPRDGDRNAQPLAHLLFDEAALRRPVDEQRRDQRRRERGDESDRDERQNDSHGVWVTRSFELGSRSPALGGEHGAKVTIGQLSLAAPSHPWAG